MAAQRKKLWPFFCFYGGKWRAAPHYPAPQYNVIVEPFAGAAGYSVRYYDRAVALNDLDPIIVGIWSYLISVSAAEILALPDKVDHVDDVRAPQEAKHLIGFWLNKATTSPCKTPSAWNRNGIRPNSTWCAVIKERIASQVEYIRHWRVRYGSYETLGNIPATWFIDPPYNNGAGRLYRCKFTDFDGLSSFAKTRRGQVLVCENVGADWLPFQEIGHFKSTQGSRGKGKTAEAIWTAQNP